MEVHKRILSEIGRIKYVLDGSHVTNFKKINTLSKDWMDFYLHIIHLGTTILPHYRTFLDLEI